MSTIVAEKECWVWQWKPEPDPEFIDLMVRPFASAEEAMQRRPNVACPTRLVKRCSVDVVEWSSQPDVDPTERSTEWLAERVMERYVDEVDYAVAARLRDLQDEVTRLRAEKGFA